DNTDEDFHGCEAVHLSPPKPATADRCGLCPHFSSAAESTTTLMRNSRDGLDAQPSQLKVLHVQEDRCHTCHNGSARRSGCGAAVTAPPRRSSVRARTSSRITRPAERARRPIARTEPASARPMAQGHLQGPVDVKQAAGLARGRRVHATLVRKMVVAGIQQMIAK